MDWYLTGYAGNGKAVIFGGAIEGMEYHCGDDISRAKRFKSKADAIIYAKGLETNWKPVSNEQLTFRYTPAEIEWEVKE